MPSVKMPRKSTDTDMTPFVDVAFLILSFFMLATKFKPPEPVEVKMPTSVSAEKLKETDAIWITMDDSSRVFFTVTSQKDKEVFLKVANNINTDRQLNLSQSEINNLANTFSQTYPVGVPFAQLKQILALPPADQVKVKQRGIPVLDSATNELVWWVAAAKSAFAGKKGVLFLIKGDGGTKYPTFGGVIDAMKRNNELKYHLITDPEGIPSGSALEAARNEEMSR
jgi:biopolymer transport protein ExbD